VSAREVWSQVGYLLETPSAYPELTVRENLEVVRRLRKVADRSAVHDVIDLFDLRPYADLRARALSLGNRQRLGLAKAFLHRPALLELDEPVNSLDPVGVVEVRTLLMKLRARDQGVTVLLSSHRLAEVARVATRIGVMHHGRLVDHCVRGHHHLRRMRRRLGLRPPARPPLHRRHPRAHRKAARPAHRSVHLGRR